MKHPRAVSILAAVLLAAGSRPLSAAPEDHLAPVPQATKVEAEVIALLQCSEPNFGPSGQVSLRVYNPTKYVLKDLSLIHI